MLKIEKYIILLFVLVLVSCNSKKSVQKVEDKPSVYTPDLKNGEKIFATCIACHGDKAQGNLALNAPTIVNQEPWYLAHQLMNFRKGIRGADAKDTYGMQMAAIAKGLPDSNAVADVVAYIKTLPKHLPETTLKGDVKAGHDKYNMICGSCHGPGATGIAELNTPKLIGMNDWYLNRQLMNFKNGIRGAHKDDAYGSQMVSMVATLKDDQAILDVIAYIQTLELK